MCRPRKSSRVALARELDRAKRNGKQSCMIRRARPRPPCKAARAMVAGAALLRRRAAHRSCCLTCAFRNSRQQATAPRSRARKIISTSSTFARKPVVTMMVAPRSRAQRQGDSVAHCRCCCCLGCIVASAGRWEPLRYVLWRPRSTARPQHWSVQPRVTRARRGFLCVMHCFSHGGHVWAACGVSSRPKDRQM